MRSPQLDQHIATVHALEMTGETPPETPPETPLDAAVRAAHEILAGPSSAGVTAAEPWAEAGWRTLRFHFARMLVRAPGVITGEDPEDVHAMRVASRRVRAAWRVFGDGFERPVARAGRHDLRPVGASLGLVRDTDVLLATLATYEASRGSRAKPGLRALGESWTAERTARHADLVHLLRSSAFETYLAASSWLLGEAPPELGVVAPGSVRVRMPAAAWSAYRDVQAFDGRLDPDDLDTLHRLRISAKWLRYTLEFVREAMGDDAAALIGPVVALQDHLGDLHDLHAAAEQAGRFAAGNATLGRRERAQVDRFASDLDRRVETLGGRLGRAWEPLASERYRRRLARVLATL